MQHLQSNGKAESFELYLCIDPHERFCATILACTNIFILLTAPLPSEGAYSAKSSLRGEFFLNAK